MIHLDNSMVAGQASGHSGSSSRTQHVTVAGGSWTGMPKNPRQIFRRIVQSFQSHNTRTPVCRYRQTQRATVTSSAQGRVTHHSLLIAR